MQKILEFLEFVANKFRTYAGDTQPKLSSYIWIVKTPLDWLKL